MVKLIFHKLTKYNKMNYQTQLQETTNQIETLQAQLATLTNQQTILTQLVDMEGKMVELSKELNTPTPTPQPTQAPTNITLTVVRDEVAVEVEEVVLVESFLEVVSDSREILSNDKCTIILDIEDREINGDDHTDPHNMPRCYNRTFRSYKKAWKALKECFTKNHTMYDCCGILGAYNVSMNTYCSMD